MNILLFSLRQLNVFTNAFSLNSSSVHAFGGQLKDAIVVIVSTQNLNGFIQIQSPIGFSRSAMSSVDVMALSTSVLTTASHSKTAFNCAASPLRPVSGGNDFSCSLFCKGLVPIPCTRAGLQAVQLTWERPIDIALMLRPRPWVCFSPFSDLDPKFSGEMPLKLQIG